MAGPWIDQPTGSFGDIGSSESAQAQMARLVSAAMILNPDRKYSEIVWLLEVSVQVRP